MNIHIDNDTIITLSGLRRANTVSYLSDADVSVTLIERDTQQEVTGQDWPAAMLYVTGSDGVYQTLLSFALNLSPTKKYTAVISVLADGARASWRVGVKATYRHMPKANTALGLLIPTPSQPIMTYRSGRPVQYRSGASVEWRSS